MSDISGSRILWQQYLVGAASRRELLTFFSLSCPQCKSSRRDAAPTNAAPT